MGARCVGCPETLAARVFQEECEALPNAIQLLAQRYQLKQ